MGQLVCLYRRLLVESVWDGQLYVRVLALQLWGCMHEARDLLLPLVLGTALCCRCASESGAAALQLGCGHLPYTQNMF